MDELELRVQGHEMALIEVVAHVGRAEILAGMAAIRDGLAGDISADERTIRLQALQLLDDAMRRHDPPGHGLHWPGAPRPMP